MAHVQAFYSYATFCCRLILLSSLYIELALVCCTNPDNVHCFGTIFPNLKLCFCLNLCHPPGAYSIRPIQKLLNCQQRDDACSWRPLDWRIRHSHLVSTLFHSLVPWWRPRRIRPQITRLSQLENSAMGTWPIYKNSIIPDWFEKWRDTKFWYMC